MATSTLRFQATVALLFVLGGCERGVPVAVQPGPQSSLGSASLSPAAWELLTGKINVAALDRLLTTLGPEDRARLLRSFEDAEWAASGRTDMETRDVVVTVRFGDPERQRLLEHVWRPVLVAASSFAAPGCVACGARACAGSRPAGGLRVGHGTGAGTMIGRYIVLSAAFALAGPSAEVRGQAIRGPTEHTTCSTPFHPAAGLTFHGGYAWAVIFHTFPYQFGFATYRALPDPATSVDGQATWSNPGAYVECTNTWFYNHNGSVAYVEYRWHIIRYLGEISANSGGCAGDDGGMTDSPYLTSYDPYAPHQGEDALQGCGDGGDDAGSGEETQTCWWEWVELEISYDGGKTWEPYWSGWGQVCEEQAA